MLVATLSLHILIASLLVVIQIFVDVLDPRSDESGVGVATEAACAIDL